MKKFVCTVCGYVHEGDCPPEKCPLCGAGADKFKEQSADAKYACEHEIGVGAKDKIEKELYDGLVAHFNGECCEVGMYLAMARQADREGYPEIADALRNTPLKKPSMPQNLLSCWVK